jgi:type 1 glutamine amidotransferase
MILALAASMSLMQASSPQRISFEGSTGPGKGKHIVLLSGDEEYRSEEALPQLAQILAKRFGFKCTVLFSLNDKGEIDPTRVDNEPGIEALDSADLCIMLVRFRRWPDSQMSHFANYLKSGKPVIGIRTSTHAFDYPADSNSPFKDFGWQSKAWPGGFGKQVLGENWVSHWGNHKVQATLAIPEKAQANHEILSGVGDSFVTTDVYEAAPPADATILMRGKVLEGMKATDEPAVGKKKTSMGVEQDLNDPMMPVAWTRIYDGKNRIFTTTMGSSLDLLDPNFRRLLVNAVFWGLGAKAPNRMSVDLVGKYEPSMYGFGDFKKGVKPADLQISSK